MTGNIDTTETDWTIDSAADAVVAVGLGILGLAAVAVALSPAIAGTLIAMHVGLDTLPAVAVGIGFYVALGVHGRVGG